MLYGIFFITTTAADVTFKQTATTLRVCYNGKEPEVDRVTKGWCENCQFQNRNGVLYCSQCGEELQNKSQRGRQIIAVVLILIIVTGLILAVWRPF
jgi:predicted nucleic acid-binding Zn ribbon protein